MLRLARCQERVAKHKAEEPLQLLFVTKRKKDVGELKGVAGSLPVIPTPGVYIDRVFLVLVATEEPIDLGIRAAAIIAKIQSSLLIVHDEADEEEPGPIDPTQRSNLVRVLQGAQDVNRSSSDLVIACCRPTFMNLLRGRQGQELSTGRL